MVISHHLQIKYDCQIKKKKKKIALGHSVFSTLQNQFKLVHGAEQNAHSTLQLISSPDQISQEGNNCTTTKEKVRAYCPNICTVKLELRQ